MFTVPQDIRKDPFFEVYATYMNYGHQASTGGKAATLYDGNEVAENLIGKLDSIKIENAGETSYDKTWTYLNLLPICKDWVADVTKPILAKQVPERLPELYALLLWLTVYPMSGENEEMTKQGIAGLGDLFKRSSLETTGKLAPKKSSDGDDEKSTAGKELEKPLDFSHIAKSLDFACYEEYIGKLDNLST